MRDENPLSETQQAPRVEKPKPRKRRFRVLREFWILDERFEVGMLIELSRLKPHLRTLIQENLVEEVSST